jgi:plastocyanin
MKRILPILTLCALAVTPALAGTITGRVRAEGKPGADSDAQCGNYDSHALKTAERVNYAEWKDFVVFIEGPAGTNHTVVPNKPLQVDTRREVSQRGARFIPHVLPVVVGTTVEWPNNDDIFHNVFSYSETKPFDLDLYKAPAKKFVTFDKPGRVDVFCSIHSSMNCVVLVLENNWFASTDAKGAYAIANVPAGNYKLKAWHERLPSQSRDIVVPANGELKMDFTLGITNLPKY